MVWTIIGGKNMTSYVRHDNFALDLGVSDNMPTCALEVKDVGSQINFTFNQQVQLWDEFVGPYYTLSGRAVQTLPTLNQLIDPSFVNSGASYTAGGVNSALVAFSSSNCNITFS